MSFLKIFGTHENSDVMGEMDAIFGFSMKI